MSARVKAPKPGEWTYTVGEPPHQVTAYERADRKYAIYSRVWDGKRNRDKRKLCGPIRDERGRIIPEREIEAQQAAIERQRVVESGADDVLATAGPLTLRQGFRRMLHPREGKYAASSEWVRDRTRQSEHVVRILGGDILWTDIRHAHYRKVWRTLAAEHRDEGLHGLRSVEMIVDCLNATARWLQGEGLIEPGTALPAPGWREAMRQEWQEITNQPPAPPKKPAYTDAEFEALWLNLHRADPRLELALEIGAELRLGQVRLRTRRSDIEPARGFRVGAVRVHGSRKKHGELVILTLQQRHVLTRALTSGVLADLEAAYRAGEIPDYYLVPGGFLRTVTDHRGRTVRRAQVRWSNTPFGKTGMMKAWRKLERLAGVRWVKGRGWYGVRRVQADRAEDVQKDARVLNRMGGWKHTSTRERYQQERRTEISEQAARTREKIRPKRSIRKRSN